MHTKNQFIQVLHGYLESSEDDARTVQSLKAEYPYSQVLHALAARLSKDLNLSTEKRDLQLAAVHAADRAVLKEVMTRKDSLWPASHEAAGAYHPETPQSISTEIVGEHGESVAEEVIQDLNRLNELKNNFESLFAQKTPETTVEPPPGGHEDAVKKPKRPVGRKRGRAKAQRIIDLAKALEKEESDEDSDKNSDEGQKKRVNGGDEDIINAIKSSKKKISPESEKQREQLNIIDQFIKTQPRISNTKDKAIAMSKDDLSSIRGGEFGDHVISETLVEILLNQGKKERAIEVLKKLIWKFPQKKAYFAAQIEDLKK